MNILSAIRAFEGQFSTVLEGGCYRPEGGNPDFGRADDGSPFIVVTSGGRIASGASPQWFSDEETAIEEWLRHAVKYRDERGGDTLWWRTKPEFVSAEMTHLDQSLALREIAFGGQTTLVLGYVWARLAISRKDDKDDA